jgi:hypothetical protein
MKDFSWSLFVICYTSNMSDERYSIMILPRRKNGNILLQTWTNDKGTITDGFGSFYQVDEDSQVIAQNVLTENLGIEAEFTKAARLQYFIDKPTGLVDLKITVYFADIEQEPSLQEQMYWFAAIDVPYVQMHPATGKWLPLILSGHTPLLATIKVHQPGDHTAGQVTSFVVN